MHDKFLNYFDEVARQGSIRKAAVVLNVSSSSINRKIISTENRLGIRLFDRTSEGVELTSAGAVVLEHCRNTLFDFERIVHVVENIRDMRTGHIHIATLDSVALSILPDTLEQFGNSYPEITFTVQTAQPDEVMQNVADGKVDIGVSFSNELHPNVRVQSEKATPIGALMRPGHPLAERNTLELEDLKPFRLIRSLDALAHRSFINEAVADQKIPLSTQVFTNSLPLAKESILSGTGIGLYSKIGFLEDIEADRLRYVPLNSAVLKDLKIGILTSSKSGQSTAHHIMCRMLGKVLRSLRLDS